MSIKLYGLLRSRVTRPVWAAKELGIAYELVPVIQSYRLAYQTAPGAPLHAPTGPAPLLVSADPPIIHLSGRDFPLPPRHPEDPEKPR